ncbi:DNA-binding transcriptional LysR family regulator [Duganella sp. 3397]|uniref:LysR substrate-binding domain-containing protein n=1 Tax=Duganella sp. 3397 TaxID=2817732 RepID=UPI002866DC50|nr:LysR substrate-binding domain-containing protein [Duganella sp. 3397]MDR7048629.1 DNA-binding transcriptional LysR family regulator [Duganella sp. 3397]
MQDLESLAIFLRIAEMASFTHAAESLGIQKGRASNVVRRIEADVGARLLHRSTRTVQLTEEGRAFYSRARALLANAEELDAMFAGGEAKLRGRLRVDLPTELARATIVPALPSFMAAYPEVQLELSSTDRRIDLIQEGMDCAIRIGGIVDSTLVARPVGALRMVNVASPAYLRRHGIPRTLDELRTQGHRMIHYAPTLGSRPLGWEYPQADGYATLAVAGSLSVNSVQTYHAAGLAGLGLMQAGLSSIKEHLVAGELVEVLPDLRPEPLPVSFVVAHRHNLSRRVRTFMEWSEGILAPYLDN